MDDNMNATDKSGEQANASSKDPGFLTNRDIQEIRSMAARRELPEESEIHCAAEIDKKRRLKHDEDVKALKARDPSALIQPYVPFTIKNVFASREESIKGRRFWHIVSDDGRKYSIETPVGMPQLRQEHLLNEKQGRPRTMPTLFLSYSRKDTTLVEQLEAALLAHGHTVWRDVESIRGGEQWPKAIGEAIAANHFFVLMWSQHAAQSHFVEFEWNTALALKKTIVPCLLDDTPLPPSLRAINGIPLQNFETGLPGLLKSLQQSSPAVARVQQASVLAKLQTLKSDAPEKVVAEAKAIFAQQGWNVQGNVYQAAGDIHVTLPPPAEEPKKKLLERWQTWVGLIGGVLAIVLGFIELREKIAPPRASNPQTDSVQAPAQWLTLKGQIKDEAGMPLDSVRVLLPELNLSDTTDANGVFEFRVYAPPQERVRFEAYRTGYPPLLRDPAWSEDLQQYQMRPK